jgi:hypothetical protein
MLTMDPVLDDAEAAFTTRLEANIVPREEVRDFSVISDTTGKGRPEIGTAPSEHSDDWGDSPFGGCGERAHRDLRGRSPGALR